ncbi:hypothetical protein ACH4FX_37035 [Streptomyces sp. NPDC018019]|uniref:hypothetical protein n=1 Tax=Streptomyces sp. NPDC018019 TaxID=3365030 RepID=UPI00378B74C9
MCEWRTVERAGELERLAQDGRLATEMSKRGDEAARDFLAVCNSSQLPAVDAWLARALAARTGHYGDPAARAAAKAALPASVQAHAALLAALARTDQPTSGAHLEFVGRLAQADPAAAAALAAWLSTALSGGAGQDVAEVHDLREWSNAGRSLNPQYFDD